MNVVNNNFNSDFNSVQFSNSNKFQFIPMIYNYTNRDVDFFKKGGEINIKKKNKGLFTKYCGGNVTSECIRKGKNSPDPKIRKRATFAANARKWKRKNGGILTNYNIDKLNDLLKDFKKNV